MATYSANNSSSYRTDLVVTQKSQSIPNNTSVVSVTLTVFKLVGTGRWAGNPASTWSLNIGGQTRSGTFTYDFRNYTSLQLFKGDFTITHDGSGAKSISASATVSLRNTGDASPSGTFALDTIPRTSSFTIPSSFNVGSAFTVSISRASSSFTHWVVLEDGSTQLYSSGSTASTSVSPNVNADTLVGRMSGVRSKVFTVRVDTYNGSTWIGTQSKSITANIPASTFTIPSSFNVGSAFTASISRVGSLLTYRIEVVDGSTSLYLTDASSSTSISTNVPPNTLLGRMSGVKSKTFTVHLHTYNNGTWITYSSKTITTNIPISTFTIPTSFTMGNAFTVDVSRVGSLTHAVELWDGNANIYASGNNVATSGSVNVTLSTLAARSPNSMSRAFTVKVITYNGSTIIGSTSKNITAYVPSSVKPTFSALTVLEDDDFIRQNIGAFIQRKSKVKLSIVGASGVYGSTINHYRIRVDGGSLSNSATFLVNGIQGAGTRVFEGEITDSRGQTFSREMTIQVLPYTPPTLSDLSFRRTLPDKTEAPLGNNVTVTANVGVHSLIVNGVEKNSLKYHVQSAQAGGSYSDKTNTTSTSLTQNYSDVWSGYSVDHSYNFRVRVGDVFGWGGWSVGVVPTGVVTQQWSSKTTSFGKMIDDTSYNVQVGTGGIQSDGPITTKDRLTVYAQTTGMDNELIWLRRKDGSYHSLISHDESEQSLRLHRYNTNGGWQSYFAFKEDGTMLAGGKNVLVDDDQSFTHRGQTNDANTAKKTGTYRLLGNVSNAPANWGALIVYNYWPGSVSYVTQQMITYDGQSYVRSFWEGTWTAWNKIT